MSEFETPPPPGDTPPPASGGVDEKTWTIIMRLTPLAQLIPIPLAGMAAALIVWLLKKDSMPAVDSHGKEVINFLITVAIVAVPLSILSPLPLVGWFIFFPLLLLLIVVSMVFVILGAIDASNGVFRRYPLTIRFLK